MLLSDFFIAENRVLNINFVNYGTSPPTSDLCFESEKDQESAGDIIGLALNTMSSFIVHQY